jgi:hypothetical protein
MDNANKIAYLGFIQNVINRMGSNSFLVKGFAITLISALVATLNGKYFFILILTILFWIIDTYYLYQERLFRNLYKNVINGIEPDDSFSMNAQKYKNEVDDFFSVMISKPLSFFYISLIIILAIMMLASCSLHT